MWHYIWRTNLKWGMSTPLMTGEDMVTMYLIPMILSLKLAMTLLFVLLLLLFVLLVMLLSPILIFFTFKFNDEDEVEYLVKHFGFIWVCVTMFISDMSSKDKNTDETSRKILVTQLE